MIADISGNKKLNQVVTELFIKGIKLNISTVFITQTYLPAPKDIRQNFAQDLLWKFQTNERFNKSQLIIHQLLTLKHL